MAETGTAEAPGLTLSDAERRRLATLMAGGSPRAEPRAAPSRPASPRRDRAARGRGRPAPTLAERLAPVLDRLGAVDRSRAALGAALAAWAILAAVVFLSLLGG